MVFAARPPGASRRIRRSDAPLTVENERIVDCPFALALERAPTLFLALGAGFDVRMPFRALSLPLSGAISRRVIVRAEMRDDPSDRGHRHDGIAFAWDARSLMLPNFSGTLRLRIEGTGTRAVLEGAYVPPFGRLGTLFDLALGHRLAVATAGDLLTRAAAALEAAWASERDAAPPDRR